MNIALILFSITAVNWQHPAGMITDKTLREVRDKVESQSWARDLYGQRKVNALEWAAVPSEELRRIFPRKGGNVYHNFSCPTDRVSLKFEPTNPDAFTCPSCEKTFTPDTDAGIYPPEDRYHGDMYAGWICLFHITTTQRMVEMAMIGRMEQNAQLLDRAEELLLLYAETIQSMPLREAPDVAKDSPMYRQYGRIFTYHREGDNKILMDLAQTYELVRDRMSPEERATVETHALQRMLDDIMLEPYYIYDHNNVYQWHRTVVQAALALEREDLVDWSFGFGEYSRENLPEHRSMSRILATHFNDDGAFWELSSGYHLYPLNALCEFAVLSRHVSEMDPERFPFRRYDLTRRESEGGQTIHNALAWFISMAMPDRTMTIIGDSTKARSGMENYTATAEIGYRYYDIKAVGDYQRYREGKRSSDGLLYGAPEIIQHDTPFTSSYLSSGWVSLRSEWQGNRVWAGLNALVKGGGHQHADHLTLTLFSQGELLALEKSVPYNEQTLRVLGTQTAAHNTVTVDFESQPQGESITIEQTPVVKYFLAGPNIQYAEVHGDQLYDKTSVYRRSVAILEDVVIDLFRVEGGTTHDWIVHHAGSRPELSPETASGTFEPAAWLVNGTSEVAAGTTDGAWTAQWAVNDVHARLTMLGSPESQIFALETYPLNNAVITEAYPPTQTLCVRRTRHAPFLAVWDAWKLAPNLQHVAPAENRPDALMLRTASHTYHLAFGAGVAQFSDGLWLETDAAFTVLRDREALTMVDGTQLAAGAAGKRLAVSADQPSTVDITSREGQTLIALSNPIVYDTYGGDDIPRAIPDTRVNVSGTWFPR